MIIRIITLIVVVLRRCHWHSHLSQKLALLMRTQSSTTDSHLLQHRPVTSSPVSGKSGLALAGTENPAGRVSIPAGHLPLRQNWTVKGRRHAQFAACL